MIVGTEGPQRGSLLLPCQHILHMGCVEFVRRRGKVLMGLDSADLPAGEGGDGVSGDVSGWARRVNGCCVCPACLTPITRIIPLYLRSADDEGKPMPSTPPRSGTAAAPAAIEAAYKRVHAAQKQVLHRLRSLCDQRRRVTELTHACASLHEQRARCLAEVEKEERCFPGLVPRGGGTDAVGRGVATSSAPATAAVERMGVTELELFMAQVTPQLLRVQADLRRERQLIERRSKRLGALRAHYHSTKELHAIDAAIARSVDKAPARRTAAAAPELFVRSATSTTPGAAAASSHGCATEAEGRVGRRGEVSTVPPPRKRQRGEAAAIDVDDAAPPEVVEVLSDVEGDGTAVLDVDAGDGDGGDLNYASGSGDGGGGSATRGAHESAGGDDDVEGAYEAPYLIPCYVCPSAAVASTALPKTSGAQLSANALRLLPRREDRLWQPSLHF